MTNKPDTLPEGRGGVGAERLEALAGSLNPKERDTIIRMGRLGTLAYDEMPLEIRLPLFRVGLLLGSQYVGPKHRRRHGACLTPLGQQILQSLLNQEKPK